MIVEPSPLTGGQQQTSVSSQGPGGETSASVSTEGPGAVNAGSSQIALGPGASLSGDDQTQHNYAGGHSGQRRGHDHKRDEIADRQQRIEPRP